MTARCFIALKFSGEVIAAVSGLLAGLRLAGADVKWVRPESMHLTLAFLGDVDVDRLGGVKTIVANAAKHRAPFEFNVAGVGGFPNLRHPRVLWAGIDAPDGLFDLQRDIEAALAGIGFAPEGRPYSPHLTLGRVRSGSGLGEAVAALRKHEDTAFGCAKVDELYLMESRLSPSGAKYIELHAERLGG
ncbi:MAG: RNA 2',3'-cyclic phosphodiesterase [Nitrospirae bacterium]|nr:RNA 2',3'-cyclic phosphodiesterase [Nitrospirota bacterium]